MTPQEPHSSQFFPSMAASMVFSFTFTSTLQVDRNHPHQHQNGIHPGRTAASLACTHSKPIHKLDVPLAPWPVSDFPRWHKWLSEYKHNLTRYQYPLEEHVKENAAEDTRCLAMAEETIEASDARWLFCRVLSKMSHTVKCHVLSKMSCTVTLDICH